MTITQAQAQKRFLLIPETLQNALFSIQIAAIIDQICTDNHLDDKRSDALVEAVGWVLLGFLHPEDIKKELEQASIPTLVAQDILNALNAKIFTSFGPLLVKTYAPLPHEEASSESAIIKNMNQPLPPVNKAPATLSDIGWSKIPSVVSPAPIAQPVSITPTPPRPATIPAPTPTAPAKPAEPAPAPMMLHEDTIFKPAEKNEGFILPKPGAGVEMHMGAGVPQAPTRPAVLEFGGVKIPVPKPPTPTTAGAYRGEFGSSLSSTPVAGAGPRNVSQIMPVARVSVPLPVPKPPATITTPPTPPRPLQATIHIPQPPTPPQPPKPIVKDFL